MTNDETPVPEPFGVVAAFLDGEQVDTARLKQALSTDEGREYLIDVLALRQSAAGVGPVSFPASASERRRSVARWAAVASGIALVASAFGYLAGERAGLSTRVTAAPRTVEAVIDFSEPARAPEPTHVIRLRPGIDRNGSGGN